MLDAWARPLFDYVFFVELHVAAVQHRILGGANVDERGFHAGQHVLHPTEVDVAVNLCLIIGWAGDVVLDQAATFEYRDLREVWSHLHAHQVAADGLAVALLAAAALHQLGIGVDRRVTPSGTTRTIAPAPATILLLVTSSLLTTLAI